MTVVLVGVENCGSHTLLQYLQKIITMNKVGSFQGINFKGINFNVGVVLLVMTLIIVMLVLAMLLIMEPLTSNGAAIYQQEQNQKNSAILSVPSTKPLIQSNNDLARHTENDKDFTEKNSLTRLTANACSAACKELIEIIRSDTALDDESVSSYSAQIQTLVTSLSQDAQLRKKLLSIAANSIDGNKRSIILDAFRGLDIHHQQALGLALAQSTSPRVRHEGINYLNDPSLINEDIANQLLIMLPYEPDSYIKSAILNSITVNPEFVGNQQIADYAYQIAFNEPEGEVKGKALEASALLYENALAPLEQTLVALGSSNQVFRYSGINAVQTILERLTKQGKPISDHDKQIIQDLLDQIISNKSLPVNSIEKQAALDVLNVYY